MYRIAVLVSGSGSNLQALIDVSTQNTTRQAGASARGDVGAGTRSASRLSRSWRVSKVVSDRRGAYALERAHAAGIPTQVVSRRFHKGSLSDRILEALPADVDAVVLAGFLSILRGEIIKRFRGRMINIHPALLPEFGGKGMYGLHVHRAVLDSGARESGCTVHIVDEGTDTGPILVQKRVSVLDGDSPESLAARVQGVEHEALVEGVSMLIERIAQSEKTVQ
ncbi:MAG: phosphoribosylglycinamide formyltransferase [Spirochaetota bacterium]